MEPNMVVNTENASGGGMSLGLKIGLSLVGVITLAFVVSALTKKKSVAAANSDINNLNGAVDAEDELAVQRMVNVFKTSPFASSLGYLAEQLPNFMQGGSRATTDDYGRITVNGVKVIPKSSAFLATVWGAWLGGYTANHWDSTNERPVPVAGKTQAEADAAASVAAQVNAIWQEYKTKKLSVIF